MTRRRAWGPGCRYTRLDVTDFVVITGLSGAGRSSVADVLEDLGWFVIDNLPTSLMSKVLELAQAPGSTIEQCGLRDRQRATAGRAAGADRAASPRGVTREDPVPRRGTDALVRRYESTRRRHPRAVAERLVGSDRA